MDKPVGRVTLSTIARIVGVHVSTVSRALSPDPGVSSSVAPETAVAIRDAAERLAYRPNLAGSALRTGRTRLLGVLVPRLTDLVLAEIYAGIDRAAAQAGYFTFVSNTDDDPQLQAQRVQLIMDRGVDGLILADARNDTTICADLAREGVPVVLVHRRVPGIPSVSVDDVLGARLVAEHLHALGCRAPAVVAGPAYASTAVDRSGGFVTACGELGIGVRPEWVIHGGFEVQAGRSATDELLASGSRPDAIFAVNDFAAIGVMGALRDAGLQPGRDVAVVGYNDVPLAAELPIALTSVAAPLSELGEAAVAMMLQVLAGERPASVCLPPTLRVRDSSSSFRSR